VAAAQQDPDAGQRLVDIWRSLSIGKVFEVSFGDLFRVPWHLLGLAAPPDLLPATAPGAPERLAGLFDAQWLEEIVVRQIDWVRLRRNIDEGDLHALAVAATEIATGRSVVFTDTHRATLSPGRATRSLSRVRPRSSLSMPWRPPPFLFSSRRACRSRLLLRRGLRLNTPLAPALRLGADRLLVIGLRHPRTAAEEDRMAHRREVHYSSPTYLVGKALNALLLDRVDYDVERLRLMNAILEAGIEEYGQTFRIESTADHAPPPHAVSHRAATSCCAHRRTWAPWPPTA